MSDEIDLSEPSLRTVNDQFIAARQRWLEMCAFVEHAEHDLAQAQRARDRAEADLKEITKRFDKKFKPEAKK